MPITGLDHLMLAVPDLGKAADAIAGSLGLRLDRSATHPDFGTANRTIRIPGLYLELITLTDRSVALRRPVGQRMAGIIGDGGGWLAFVCGAKDLPSTVERLRASGVELDAPHEGRAVRPDGVVRRWWLAGHGEDFRAGRMPSLIEYESPAVVSAAPDDLGYEVRGVARVDVATTDLDDGVRRFRALFGVEPEPGTATFRLPDGTDVRLVARDTTPGLCRVALEVDDVRKAAAALAGRGVETTEADGEILVDPHRTANASFALTPPRAWA